MPIAVTCSQCRKNFRVADDFAGKQGRCPQCNFVLIVPHPEARGSKPFGESAEPPTPPPPRREPRDEPPAPPRRRSERDDDRPPRPPRRPERERARDDEDDYDVPVRDRTPLSWQIVGLGRNLLMFESILNLVGRGCVLLLVILQLMSDPYSRRDLAPISLALSLIAITTLLGATVFGLVGRLSTRFAPDSVARSEGGVSTLLTMIALGVLLLTQLLVAFMFGGEGPRSSRGIPGEVIVVLVLMLIGLCLTYASEVFVARFISRIGILARNRSLAGWGPILSIYLYSLMGVAAVTFLVALTSDGGELIMVLMIIFLALDYGSVVMCMLPRPRLARALRQLHVSGPSTGGNDRFDEDEDDDRPNRRERRRPRDEEND